MTSHTMTSDLVPAATAAAPLIVIARARVRPESRDRLIEAARTCIAATRAEEGCITYDMHESVTEPGRFVFVEQWHDRAALDAHMATPHLQALMAAVAPILAEPPMIEAIAGGDRTRLM